jgi:tetratricopeptide (TPR) repeat protein
MKFEEIINQIDFPENRHIAPLVFLGRYHNKMNFHFLDGSFDDALQLIPDVLKGIENNLDRIDQHHIMVLYYKIACIYFGVEDYKQCIAYLEKIINNKNLVIHEDLMCFSRVLYVVAHYEAGYDYQLETQLKQTYKFLLKMNELQAVQKAMLQFLRSLTDLYPGELKAAFKRLHNRLKEYENDPYEKRAFLYLDILSWLESKIQNRPIASVIKEKAVPLIR